MIANGVLLLRLFGEHRSPLRLLKKSARKPPRRQALDPCHLRYLRVNFALCDGHDRAMSEEGAQLVRGPAVVVFLLLWRWQGLCGLPAPAPP